MYIENTLVPLNCINEYVCTNTNIYIYICTFVHFTHISEEIVFSLKLCLITKSLNTKPIPIYGFDCRNYGKATRLLSPAPS